MAHRFEKGKHIYFLFRGGYTVQDSQLKPRYYLDRKKAEEYLPYGDEIVEYAPALTLDDIIPHGRWTKDQLRDLIGRLRYYATTYAIGDNLGREIQGTDELLFEAADVIYELLIGGTE